MYSDNAIGLVTDNANWANPNFHFVVAEAVESWHQPNPNLKAIEQRCAQLGIPMLALVRFNVDFYVMQQYPMDETRWPSLAQDEPLQRAIEALQNRRVYGVILEVMDAKRPGKSTAEDPDWISFASKMLAGRLSDWLAEHKPGVKLYLGSSNEFISKFAPAMNNWVGQYPSYICQDAGPLVASYPQEGDKPQHLDNRATRELWRYRAHLVLADRTPEAFYKAIGFSASEEPPAIEDPDEQPVSRREFNALVAQVAAIEQELNTKTVVLQQELTEDTKAQIADLVQEIFFKFLQGSRSYGYPDHHR